jgi:V/A-type H+-transporting ATPase subunit B
MSMRKVYDRVHDMRGNLITVIAQGVGLGELVRIYKQNGTTTFASVLRFDDDLVTLQVFESTRGISTGDKVVFLNQQIETAFDKSLLGRRFDGTGTPIDDGPAMPPGQEILIGMPSINPTCRIMANELIRTDIPMIDMFNCLVKSQKIPIFSVAGEPYNQLLMRIANQTNADVVVIAGMGLSFRDYQAFIDNAEGAMDKTVMYIHRATESPVECLLVPDRALAVAEKFALEGKAVLVLMTDMTAYADALKEISITMDQIAANRGYPASLYSELAARYEKAVDMEGHGSITILAVTTMPAGDVTHPIPDNTGYITEGQFYLNEGKIDLFGSLSRLKQLVIGSKTREDHGDLANAMVRLYADSKKAKELQSMGFRLSSWHEKLLRFAHLFEEGLMSLEVRISLEDALDRGWHILAESGFELDEVGIKKSITDKYWPKERDPRL